MNIKRRFYWSSTATQVLEHCDLSGKIYLITGSTNGIGFEAAKALSKKGAEVIISGRSEATCYSARSKILRSNDEAKISILPLDLTSLRCVKDAATAIKNKYGRLDGLILNAGVFCPSTQNTDDGFETTFQVNHLAHFYLVLLLESLLQKNSRIVIVTSSSHICSFLDEDMTLEVINSNRGYFLPGFFLYSDSKLFNILLGLELGDRLSDRGVDVMSAHPGNLINTSIKRSSCVAKVIMSLASPFSKSIEQGASTLVYCATAPELSGCRGEFFEDTFISTPSTKGSNRKMARKLWDMSVAALKLRGLPIPPTPILL